MPDQSRLQDGGESADEQSNTNPDASIDKEVEEIMGSIEAKDIVEENSNVKDEAESNSENAPQVVATVSSVKVKKSPKKLIILLAVIVLLVSGGIGAYLYLNKKEQPVVSSESSITDEVQRLGVAVGLVEGTSEYSVDDGASWQALTVDSELQEKDKIRTSSDGRVVLLVDDGSAVRLGFNAAVTLQSLAIDDVAIINDGGEVYTRVSASSERKFSVLVDSTAYVAKGTAYRTINLTTKKGVEVYHSTVAKGDTEVTEGNAYFTLIDQKEKENTLSTIDIATLKKDEFIKWNSEQDKKEAEFANALGVLVELDKPDPAPAPVATPAATPAGITLSSSVSEYSAVFSWKVSGVDTSKGYKLVKSKTSQTPTYPENSVAYIESGKTSYSLYLGDGKTYYFRICAYREGSCESYSNTVTVTTPLKEVEKPTTGAVVLSLIGTVASWTYSGTAPHGFKVVISEAPATPSYGSALSTKYTSSPHDINYLDPGTYNIRVCKYTASSYEGGCMDYSNMEQIVIP